MSTEHPVPPRRQAQKGYPVSINSREFGDSLSKSKKKQRCY